METDDFAYNADEDFSSPNLDSELLAGFEGKKYYRLCFDCFKITKQEVGSEISAEEDLEDSLADTPLGLKPRGLRTAGGHVNLKTALIK